MQIKKLLSHGIKILTGKEKVKILIEKKINSHNFWTKDLIVNSIENQNIYKKLITIDGIGFCGSSAITDFLGEFDNCTSLGGVDMRENPERGKENSFEVDFFRDSYGVLALENICHQKQLRINGSFITNFINYSIKNYNSGIKIYDDLYLSATKKFLANIIDFKNEISENNFSYFPKFLSVAQFREYAKDYLSTILKSIPSKENLILDNLMSISEPNGDLLQDYFGDFKQIFVYCDPRDIYARARLQPGNDWIPRDPEIFVKYYLRVLSLYLKSTDKHFLCINFDEFINDYESTSKKIISFLELKEENHRNKFKYFNPDISKNNTQVYKKLENQEPIKYIYEHLKEYCYEEK